MMAGSATPLRVICRGTVIGNSQKTTVAGQPTVYRYGQFVDGDGVFRKVRMVATVRKHRKTLQFLPDGAPVHVHGNLAFDLEHVRGEVVKPIGIVHVTKMVRPGDDT